MMKKILTAALAAMMILSSIAALAENNADALDAFASIAGRTVETQAAGMTSSDYLDKVMSGAYSAAPADAAAAAKMAPELAGLSGVTTKDIAVYSAQKQIQAEQVRNKYYRALANVLKAEIMVNPAAGETYKNVELILSLFLDNSSDNLAKISRDAVRSSITKEHTQAIAKEYNVPQGFVEFVVMNDNWNNERADDDNAWKQNSHWNTNDLTPDSLDNYLGTDGIANTIDYTPDGDSRDVNGNTIDANTDGVNDTPNDVNTPDNTPDYNTPDRNTPDYNTPNTPDYNTPDRNTPDYNTPNTPKKADTPNTPNTPDTPKRADTPNTPDTPRGK